METTKSRQEEFWQNKIGDSIHIIFKSGCSRSRCKTDFLGAQDFYLTGYEEGVIFVRYKEPDSYYERSIMIYTDSIQMVW